MANDAEKKNISRLDFNVNDALTSLDEINKKLKTVSDSSEAYTKKISKNMNSAFSNYDYSKDIADLQKKMKKYEELTVSQQKSVSTSLHKEINKRFTNELEHNQKVIRQQQKAADTEEKINQTKNAKIEIDNNKHQNKLEEINARQLKSTKTLYDKISEYAKTYIIYQGFNELRNAVSQTIDEMVEVQYQMVQIDRVLNESSLNIDVYRDKLINLAYEYGNSFENVADITLRLAQAGFDSEESLALAEKTLLALNTAELDATQSTEDMVAVMAQWGLMTGTASEQADRYGKIIDKINKVADNFPTTSADILEALKKTSSAFNLAGASIDETIAMIVAAETASQRGGKTIGTALSNIIQQLKAEGRIDIMESLGIDVYKDASKQEFTDIIDIFGQLSERMQMLKDSGKEGSAEMQKLLEVFTVFRRNIGASLLGEMAGEESTYAEVLETSIKSIGYSLQENEKHMKTAKAAQAQFNATLMELKTAVWDNGVEDMFRSMLLLGSDVAKVFTGLIETFGSVPTAIGVATLAFTTLNKNIRIANNVMVTGADGTKKIVRQYSDWIVKIKEVIKNVKQQNQTVELTANGTQKVTTNIKGMASGFGTMAKQASIATLKTIGLEVATLALNAALTMGLSVAITAVVTAIDNLIHKEEKAQEKFEETISLHNEKISSYEQEKQEIDDLIDKYEELSNADTQTPETLREIEEIKIKINNILTEEGKQIVEINDNYSLQLGLLKDISKEKLRSIVKEQKEKMEETKEKNKGIKQYGVYSRQKTMVGPTEENVAAIEREVAMMEMMGQTGTKAYESIKEKAEELRSQLDENNEVTNSYINSLAELKKEEWFPEGTITNAQDLEEVLAKISEGNFNFSDGLIMISENLGLAGQDLETFKVVLEGLIKEEYADFNAQTELLGGNVSYLDQVVGTHLDTLQMYADKYAILRTAQDEYNQTGAMTISTLKNLINNDLLQYLSLQDGQLKINAQSMLNLAEATKVEAIENLKAAASADLNKIAIGDLKSISNVAKGAIASVGNNAQTSGDKMETAAGKAALLAVELQAVADAAEGNLGEGVDLETYRKQAQSIINTYSGLAKNISKINIKTAAYTPQKLTSSGGSSSSSAQREAERAKQEAERAAEEAKKAAEEEYKARLKAFEEYIDETERLEKRWVDKQKDLGQLSNQDFMYIMQQRIERYKKYIEEVKKATWMSEEDRLKLIKEYSEKIEDYQLDYIGYLKDQLDEEIDALEKATDEKIELIEKEADARIEALDKVSEATDRFREKQDYESERQSILDEISYWEQRTGREAQEALVEARKKLAELDEEWKETQEDWSIEDQIKKIEEERDAEIKALEEARDAEIKAMQDVYDAKVKMFAETGEIIYEGSVIQAESLYNAYKKNFIDPISTELQNLNKAATTQTPAQTQTQTQTQQYETYLIKSGDTLSKIAKRYGTTVEKLMAANPYITNKNRIYAGKTLQIPKFHEGGIVGGTQEAFALLKPNEVILKTEWAASLNRMMKYFDNVTTGKTNGFTNNPVIEVKGNLIQIDADIKSKSDVDYLERRIEKMLKSKFNIKK